jgi:hypothetical protein
MEANVNLNNAIIDRLNSPVIPMTSARSVAQGFREMVPIFEARLPCRDRAATGSWPYRCGKSCARAKICTVGLIVARARRFSAFVAELSNGVPQETERNGIYYNYN